MLLQHGRPRNLVNGAVVREDLKLLEVSDEHLLQEIIRGGVTLKGNAADEAVLCTRHKTYALKYVETTNTQLLVAPQATKASHVAPVTVVASCRSHIEVVEVAPRLSLLRTLLDQSCYGLADETRGHNNTSTSYGQAAKGHTFDELLAVVQASASELQAGLSEARALEVHGRWCSVNEAYLGTLLELIILTAQQEGLPLHSIPGAALVTELGPHGYQPAVIAHCLAQCGDLVAGEALDGTWSLAPAKVCTHFALSLLAQTPQMPLDEFMVKWRTAVPSDMVPELAMLRGEALVIGSCRDARIKQFRSVQLPRQPAQRFAALFRERARWEHADLEPYLADLRVPGQTAGALLLKFTRASQMTPNDPVSYTAR